MTPNEDLRTKPFPNREKDELITFAVTARSTAVDGKPRQALARCVSGTTPLRVRASRFLSESSAMGYRSQSSLSVATAPPLLLIMATRYDVGKLTLKPAQQACT